jgi:hypothetical protein
MWLGGLWLRLAVLATSHSKVWPFIGMNGLEEGQQPL